MSSLAKRRSSRLCFSPPFVSSSQTARDLSIGAVGPNHLTSHPVAATMPSRDTSDSSASFSLLMPGSSPASGSFSLSESPSPPLGPITEHTGFHRNNSSHEGTGLSTPSSLVPEHYTSGVSPAQFAASSRCQANASCSSSSSRNMIGGPPGCTPPSALYTAVISPKEMAAHEATNFKDVKGVYKNCRGIWAAQWTDERGQRHTKYFNPKYYSTEAEARREAFKFKVHIAREIELRGGVQKRRTTSAALGAIGGVMRANESLLQHSYIRDRTRRPHRSKGAKANGLRFMVDRELEKNVYDSRYTYGNYGHSGYDQPSLALGTTGGGVPNAALLYQDYLIMQQQQQQQHQHQQHQQQQQQQEHQQQQQQHHHSGATQGNGNNASVSQYVPLSPGTADYGVYERNDNSGRHNRCSSPVSSPEPVFYTSAFDPVYLAAAAAAAAGFGSPHDSTGSGNSVPGFRLGQPITGSPYCTSSDNDNLISGGQNNNGNVAALSVVPHGTSLCVCGCGGLALSPSRYAAHHHHLHQPAPSSQYLASLTSSCIGKTSRTTHQDESLSNIIVRGDEKQKKKLPVFPVVIGQDTSDNHDIKGLSLDINESHNGTSGNNPFCVLNSYTDERKRSPCLTADLSNMPRDNRPGLLLPSSNVTCSPKRAKFSIDSQQSDCSCLNASSCPTVNDINGTTTTTTTNVISSNNVSNISSCSPNSSSYPEGQHTVESSASFPFAMSWIKCFSLYASYPTGSDNNANHNNGHHECSTSGLEPPMSSDITTGDGLICRRRGTSSASGPAELDAAEAFRILSVSEQQPSILPDILKKEEGLECVVSYPEHHHHTHLHSTNEDAYHHDNGTINGFPSVSSSHSAVHNF